MRTFYSLSNNKITFNATCLKFLRENKNINETLYDNGKILQLRLHVQFRHYFLLRKCKSLMILNHYNLFLITIVF